jgi:hypothetical protein
LENDVNENVVYKMKKIKEEIIGKKVKRKIEGEVDVRRKKYKKDSDYLIEKEILMNERKYKKEIEVIRLWLSEEVRKEEGEMKEK